MQLVRCRLILGTVECQTKLGRFAASNLPSLTFPEAQEAEMQNTEILKDSPLRREFPITVWPNATSPQGERKMASVTGLIRKAEKHRVAWNGKEETRDAAKKKLMLYKCSEYEGNYRKGDNLTHVYAVEIDIDGGLSFKESFARLKKAGIAAGLYSTPSYYIKGEAHRVLVPLSEPHSVPESVEVINRINFLLGGAVTLETVSKGQGMFMGMLGDDKAVTQLTDGKFADEVLAEAESWPVNPNKSGEHGGDKRTTEDIEKAVIDGERRPNLPKLAMRYALAGRDAGTIRSKLIKLMDECGRSDSYEEYIADMDRIVGDGIRYAEKFKARKAEEAESLLSDEDVDGADVSVADPAAIVDQFGLITAFAEQQKDKLAFNHTTESWLRWTGTTWEPDETGHSMRAVRALCEATAPKADSKAQRRSIRSQTNAEAVLRGARTEETLSTHGSEWDADPMKLGTNSGPVDLTTGKVCTGAASDRISRSTSCEVGKASEALRFLNFLNQAQDPETIVWLQRWCGYLLTGDTSEQKALFIGGPGGTGKSMFLETLAYVMGTYALVLDSNSLLDKPIENHTQEIAKLNGPRLWHSSEVKKGKSLDEKKFKSLVGGDGITARQMRQGDEDFHPKGKLVLATNTPPKIQAADHALQRRIQRVTFDKRPREVDLRLPEKLRAEAPHILAWMIEGCLEWQKHGLGECPKQQRDTAEFFEDQDPVQRWLSFHCVVDDDAFASNAEIEDSYGTFAEAESIGSLSQRALLDALYQKGFLPGMKRFGDKKRRGRIGLRVKSTLEVTIDEII
jgi:putative DNA primase/helicase